MDDDYWIERKVSVSMNHQRKQTPYSLSVITEMGNTSSTDTLALSFDELLRLSNILNRFLISSSSNEIVG